MHRQPNESTRCPRRAEKLKAVPTDVTAILERSCTGCHSDDGGALAKSHFNFTKWNEYSAEERTSIGQDIEKMVSKGKMPPKKFLKSYPDLKLSGAEKKDYLQLGFTTLGLKLSEISQKTFSLRLLNSGRWHFATGRSGRLPLRACAQGNKVSEELINYHRAVAAGGIGMTTVAYAAADRSGLSFPHQLWLNEGSIPDLMRLTDAVHNEGAACSIQIGHCGDMTSPAVTGIRPMSPSARLNLYGPNLARPMGRRKR